MVQITYTLRLDMRDTGIVNTSLRLKQGDSGMKIAVNVFNGGVSAFDSSTTPKIVFRRPDGASVMADMTVESSLYSYTLVGNELQVPGKELIDIKFPIGAEGRESTMSCSIEVVPDTITPNTHGSGIYDNDLAELVEEATEAAETVQEVVGDSEAWADGTRGGVPVGPDDPAYHNNSKYWSEQANPTALANLTDVDVDGVANGDVLQYNSSTQKWEGKSISSGTNEIIAPVEGATSLHAYAVGKQLIYNDTLYKVIAPIAVNDALVVDTNIEVSPKTVIEQVEDLDANKMSYAVNSRSGVHNFLKNTGTTKTDGGVTFTVTTSGDNEGMVNANGTAGSDGARFDFTGNVIKAGQYVAHNSTDQPINYQENGVVNHIIPANSKALITWTQDIKCRVIWDISATVTVSNKKFYPMLTAPEDTDPTYAPYAMTNRELTEVKTTSVTENGVTYNFFKVGKVVMFSMYTGSTTSAVSANANILTIPTEYLPYTEIQSLFANGANGRYYSSNGKIVTAVQISAGAALRGTITYIAK